MKKLMIAAAAAAMVGGAFAEANSYEPQVYDMTITLKTSVCNDKGALSASICEDTIVYRDQKTVKLQGLFWGCGCNVIACPEAFTTYENDGYVFWFPTTKLPWTGDTSFEWSVLNLIGKKADKVEGAWTLTLGEYAELNGAGFGTAKFYDCGSEYNYIKSMNGSVVGGLAINELGKGWIGCKYCGEEVDCGAWAFCACVDNTDTSASSGTWTLKYNSSLTKALANGKYITEAAKSKLPKAVLEYLLEGADPDDPVDPAKERQEKAIKAYQIAQEGVLMAEEAVKDVTCEISGDKFSCPAGINLTNVQEQAKADYTKASNDCVVAEAKLVTANEKAWLKAASSNEVLNADIEKQQKIIDSSTDAKKIADAQKKIEADKADIALNDAAIANVMKVATAAEKANIAKVEETWAAKKSAKEAKDLADEAVNTWKNGKETDEGSFLKAEKDAKKDSEEAKDALRKAELECVASGAQCF